MCCLFGLIDYRKNLSLKKRQRILRVLAIECEERGTDATGIAFFINHHLTIQKAPKPAHKMRFHLENQAYYIMGHTRLTTQGSEKQNQNNHPFAGSVRRFPFALAHNGVLYNDEKLKVLYNLPDTKIETDSYVAVQLLEKEKKLDFNSLRKMAETVRGNFTFTILDRKNNLYIVKGSNPMCIAHFKEAGFYLYASTQSILCRAIGKFHLDELKFEFIPIKDGDILCIRSNGKIHKAEFDISSQWEPSPIYPTCDYGYSRRSRSEYEEYIHQLMTIAEQNGIGHNVIQLFLDAGYSWMDIEEIIYCPEVLDECLSENYDMSFAYENQRR